MAREGAEGKKNAMRYGLISVVCSLLLIEKNISNSFFSASGKLQYSIID